MMPSALAEHAWSQSPRRPEVAVAPSGDQYAVPEFALAWHSFKAFVRLLRDSQGNPLLVPWHIEDWCDLMQQERLLALLAARDHGKTVTVLAYIAWRLWRHNRAPTGELLEGRPDGTLEIVYFSAVIDQATLRFGLLQQFLVDNDHLFADILPIRSGVSRAEIRDVWSKTQFRLRNGAQAYRRSIGSSVRGIHPSVVVADDIVEDKNSTTELQRNRVWGFLAGTIIPMAGQTGQVIVLGTPQHKRDALHRLHGFLSFRWLKYRALDPESGEVLWPARYDLAYLLDLQKGDPLLFSREYQMDPRDDAASIFPYTLTAKPVELGLPYGWRRPYLTAYHEAGDVVVAGGDLSLSEAAAADYTVYEVALWNKFTQRRRLIWAERHRGLTFDEQVTMIRDLCRDFSISIFVIEQNNFQKWLKQHLARWPETAARVFGHTTGVERQDLHDGIPGLKLVLENDLWQWPTATPDAADFVATLRSELSAFGWADGKLGGVGEHDDTVLAFWLTERAIRLAQEYQPMRDDVVVMEDIGIEPVRIGDDI